jgi:hypothetical protein
MSQDTHVIMEVGAWGGSVTLVGIKTSTGWRFACTTDESFFSFMDEFTPDQFRSTWNIAETWEDALALLDEYPWASLFPIRVHPEFAQRVWNAVAARIEARQTDGSAFHQDNLERWHKVCFDKPIRQMGLWDDA